MTKCDASKELKEPDISSDSLVHALGEDGARGYQLLCGRTKGCLLIGGQPVYDLMSVIPLSTPILLLDLFLQNPWKTRH